MSSEVTTASGPDPASGPTAQPDAPAVPEPPAPEPTGSRLDDWWQRLMSTPARERMWRWGGPLAVTLLAAVLRLVNLAHPHSLVFDETFYVKDAWTTWNLGYEASWPADVDGQFAAGGTALFHTNASFAVHPPLGKWIIGAGMALFGPDSSFGWRIAVAVCGILLVLLTALIATRLLHSTLLGTIAGFLLAIDGHAISMSRVGILDGIVALFLLLGFGAVLLDRQWHATRLAAAVARAEETKGRAPDWGPALWNRPWVLAAAVAFGLASSVKWSGLYFLAAFGVYLIVVDALARRRLGIPLWFSSAVLKQGPVTFLLLVPLALASYLVTWIGWFATSGGMYRTWAQDSNGEWTGPFAWVPLAVQNFWHLEVAVYNYHVNEHSPHPYQANPLSWLFLVRPTQMYVNQVDDSVCGGTTCYENITSIANPIIWWAATAAIFYLVYRLVRKREWQVGLILMGMVAGYLPWLLYINRTVFQFYTIAFEPYMILGLTFVIGMALGSRGDPRWLRTRSLVLVGAFLEVCVLVSAWFYPVWTGMPVPAWFLSLHYWLPTWR
ncbi:phospholipid carrier-dependent glycosyltransferase [Herbiconiux moechotypicola]|uniref:Polyprenol-phosphate-mannose--protein mannosyltransferase n=1 Tax=Herbiconiux moechotypicola TaxID=637393 RepID=A0ABN3DW97_9MICO|nr:phospholipid carrier-dependent glycosyltransferase [Herbiconiux moechotypicola]MCS5730937.1 phospholipid carrier-dependent glycosyltransferase [Herbiconiux moechotypicola]